MQRIKAAKKTLSDAKKIAEELSKKVTCGASKATAAVKTVVTETKTAAKKVVGEAKTVAKKADDAITKFLTDTENDDWCGKFLKGAGNVLYTQGKDMTRSVYTDILNGQSIGTELIKDTATGLAYTATHIEETYTAAKDQIKTTLKEQGGWYLAGEAAAYVGEAILAKKLAGGSSTAEGANAVEVPKSLLVGEADTYVYYGIKDGERVYVGISKDVARRQAQHGYRFEYLQKITDEPLTRRQARAIEQVLIEDNPNYTNLINSISSTRDWYKDAVTWGWQWLIEHGEIINGG